jgi:N-acetylglutamate synthase-like GNAT family acetyltransferase
MPWTFHLCNDRTPFCPTTRHGHLYRPDGEIGLLFPPLDTKELALSELYVLADICNIEPLQYRQIIAEIEKQISDSGLPDTEPNDDGSATFPKYHRLAPNLITEQDAVDINLLLPQLTTMEKPLDIRDLVMIASRSFVLVARDEAGMIAGMGSLHLHHKLTGTMGTIEDVVVDTVLSGRGIGTALITKLIDAAHACGIKKLELTSNPARVAANRLYQKLGFNRVNTNHYRMIL